MKTLDLDNELVHGRTLQYEKIHASIQVRCCEYSQSPCARPIVWMGLIVPFDRAFVYDISYRE